MPIESTPELPFEPSASAEEPTPVRELMLKADEVIGVPPDATRDSVNQQFDLYGEIVELQAEIAELESIVNGPDELLGQKKRLRELRQMLVDARVELAEERGGDTSPPSAT